MKVVLLQDIDKLGKRGEVKEVKPGYARNYLIPRQFAMVGHAGNLKVAEHMEAAFDRRAVKQKEEIQAMLKGLENVGIEIKAKASGDGKLFGSVTPKDIVAQLSKLGHNGVEEKWITSAEPVKTVGEHMLSIVIDTHTTIPLRVNVVAE